MHSPAAPFGYIRCLKLAVSPTDNTTLHLPRCWHNIPYYHSPGFILCLNGVYFLFFISSHSHVEVGSIPCHSRYQPSPTAREPSPPPSYCTFHFQPWSKWGTEGFRLGPDLNSQIQSNLVCASWSHSGQDRQSLLPLSTGRSISRLANAYLFSHGNH